MSSFIPEVVPYARFKERSEALERRRKFLSETDPTTHPDAPTDEPIAAAVEVHRDSPTRLPSK
jgi:hypothetical protein